MISWFRLEEFKLVEKLFRESSVYNWVEEREEIS